MKMPTKTHDFIVNGIDSVLRIHAYNCENVHRISVKNMYMYIKRYVIMQSFVHVLILCYL